MPIVLDSYLMMGGSYTHTAWASSVKCNGNTTHLLKDSPAYDEKRSH